MVTKQAFIDTLRRRVSELFSKSMKELGMWVIRFDGATGILKCHYRHTEESKTLLCSLTTIESIPVTIITHATSGTIKTLRTQNEQHDSSFKYHKV